MSMDYQIELSNLQSKSSDFDSLKSKVSSFINDCDSSFNNLSGTEISNLSSDIKAKTERLKKAYDNCSNWLNDYLNSLNQLESSLASFSNSNISAPKEFTHQFVDLFGRVVMPTLKTNGDKNANLTLGNLGEGTEETGEVVADGTFQNYYQGDYKNVRYGSSGTISSAGCGPASLAMVLQYKTGKKIDPTVTAAYAVEHNYRHVGNGTSEELFPAMASEYGVSCTQEIQSADNIRKALKSGKVLIMHMKKGHFTNGGHYIVIKGITADGKAIVADPASKSRSSKTWDIDLIARETKGHMYSF